MEAVQLWLREGTGIRESFEGYAYIMQGRYLYTQSAAHIKQLPSYGTISELLNLSVVQTVGFGNI